MGSCRVGELWKKDVICVSTGACLGHVDDVVVDLCTARLIAIVIYGRARLFGLLGREEDFDPLGKDPAHRGGYHSGQLLPAGP